MIYPAPSSPRNWQQRNTHRFERVSAWTIRVRAYLFDLDQKTLKLGLRIQSLQGFLALNGGVKVYRDHLRVYDYGEPGNDWLNLDKTRVNEPVRKIGNRNIIAAVILDRRKSERSQMRKQIGGLIEGKPYTAFRDAINFVIDLFAQQRNRDKEKIRRLYEDNPSSQPVTYEIDDLKDVIEDKLQSIDLKARKRFTMEVTKGLDRIKSQYLSSQKIL